MTQRTKISKANLGLLTTASKRRCPQAIATTNDYHPKTGLICFKFRKTNKYLSFYTVFQKKFTLFVFTITKSDVDQF